jgi:signal transduction histidine kinase
LSPRAVVVEPSLTVRMHVGETLTAAGFDVVACGNAAEAKRACASSPAPTVVVVAALLPDARGADLVRALRTASGPGSLSAILLASADEKVDADTAGDPAVELVVKPYDPSALAACAHALVARAAGAAPWLSRRARVLAVDDSATFRERISAALDADGYEVITASSGEDALVRLGEQAFDAILLDMVMPGMSGDEVCRRIRARPELRAVPLLMLTACDGTDPVIVALRAGADDFVTKTDELAVLQARLRAQLRRRAFEEENRRMREELLDARLAASKAQAEQRLAETRARLLHDLEAKNAALEESNRRQSEFLAMLSHELRNPLAPICNSLHVLGRVPPGSDPAGRALAVIRRQVAHLTHLVDDLLDVTRITRGKIQLQRERLDLTEVVRGAVEDHRATFTEARLALDVQAPAAPVWIDGDRTRITQVMGNLLQNAAKFTEAGGAVTVTVELDARAAEAAARVRDTGAGIAPELLAHVFEPFTQADTSLERRKGGLGLGLATVKGLVELHGGRVSAHSEGLGRGAELVVRLPLQPIALEGGAA